MGTGRTGVSVVRNGTLWNLSWSGKGFSSSIRFNDKRGLTERPIFVECGESENKFWWCLLLLTGKVDTLRPWFFGSECSYRGEIRCPSRVYTRHSKGPKIGSILVSVNEPQMIWYLFEFRPFYSGLFFFSSS